MSARSQLRNLLEHAGRGRVIVVSNREPFIHETRDGRIVWTQPAGGLTSALDPLLRWSRGIWVAHGGGRADREAVDRNSRVMVPPDQPSYTLKRVWIPDQLQRGSYMGLANRGLWPLCHNVYQRPHFSDSDWECYRRVNEIFCQAVLEEAGDGPATVFIQDYQLALLPRMLKHHNDRLRVAHFWHIPWPGPEIFSIFPWQQELLAGLLGNDLLAFQVANHSTNFLRTVERSAIGVVDARRREVIEAGKLTVVRDVPIGIDFERHCAIAHTANVCAALERWRQLLGPDVSIGIGIDRLDYTKGIPERLRALDQFLRDHPQWRGKLVFVQVGVPSRGEIDEYQALAKDIERQVTAMNSRWGVDGWQPVLLITRCLPLEELIALHRIASFCMVTPLHDGMNLVAKEFVASREDFDGVLILSRFAGAAAELGDALLVNPFSEGETAGAIATALSLSRAQKRRRMSRMRDAVASNTTFEWAAAILSELLQLNDREVRGRFPRSAHLPRAAAVTEASLV